MSALVSQLIMMRGHCLVFWAPYYPVDGPIEYVFNTIQQAIALSMYVITDINDLINKVIAIVRFLIDFVNYFIHCGFVLS